ncbi:GNAT family N-acetyltransferase [bacterium]|nr:GNAT family N-acetyltransferase [bacterium]
METPVLETNRVIIKLLEPEISNLVLQYYLRNKESFAATESLRPSNFYTLAYWTEQAKKSLLEFKNDQAVRFCLFDKLHPDKMIGTVNFTQIFRGPFQACYLGYALDKKSEGKGLMTEALAKAIQYMFDELNLHRVMANYLPDNARSARVLEKLGFVIEGRAQKYLFINGDWREHILTSLTNDNWRHV